MASLLMRGAAVLTVAATAAFGQTKPLIERTEAHDWVLNGTVSVRAYARNNIKSNMPERASFDFTSAAVVFPMIEGSASSITKRPPELGGSSS